MKAGVTCTDDLTKSHPFDGLRSELTIKGYLGVSVQPCCVQDRHRPLTSPPEGSEKHDNETQAIAPRQSHCSAGFR